MVSDVSLKRGRSFRIASSKAIICAVSNSEPIGSTESCRAAVVGHRLRRDHRHHVDELGEPAVRLRRDQRGARARRAGDAGQRAGGREIAGPGRDDEEIAGGRPPASSCRPRPRRCGPCGTAAWRSRASAGPRGRGRTRRCAWRATISSISPSSASSGIAANTPSQIGERALRERAQSFGHRFLPCESGETAYTDFRVTIGHSTLIWRGRAREPDMASNSHSAAIDAHFEMRQQHRGQRRVQVLRDLAVVVAHHRDVVGNRAARARAAPRSSRPPSGRWRRRSRSAARPAPSAPACAS